MEHNFSIAVISSYLVYNRSLKFLFLVLIIVSRWNGLPNETKIEPEGLHTRGKLFSTTIFN